MITKPKNRYLLVESSSPLNVVDRSVAEDVSNAVAFEMGAIGYVKANPKIVYQAGERSFVFRVNRGHEDDLVLALSFVKKISGRKFGFYTLKISGTIRKLLASSKKQML